MKTSADAPFVYPLLVNAAANGAGGFFNAGDSKGLYVVVSSASTSSAVVSLQQSLDKIKWVTVYTVTNPATAGTVVLLPPAPYTQALVSSYVSGIITAKIAGINAPVTKAGLLAATDVSFGAGVFTSVTDSGLTSGRVPVAGTGGLLGDDASFTFSGGVLSATTFNGGRQDTVRNISGNGAISVASGAYFITKGSALGSSALATPAAGTDDGKLMRFISTTAFAHVIDYTTGKVNGVTGTHITFTSAAIGDSISVMAYNGVWHVVASRGTITFS
jgi:hypothetical protein